MLKHLSFKKIVLALFLLLLLYYALLFMNTNSVMRYAKSVFRGEIAIEEVVDSPMYRYYPKNEFKLEKVDLKLHRTFVWHNFSDGYIWVKYDVAHLDSSGHEYSGSRNIPSKWKIHKENGEWKVVEIEEDP